MHPPYHGWTFLKFIIVCSCAILAMATAMAARADAIHPILTVFYNVERPTGGPEWNIRFQMTFMFPR
jgi:hypothetical protein